MLIIKYKTLNGPLFVDVLLFPSSFSLLLIDCYYQSSFLECWEKKSLQRD